MSAQISAAKAKEYIQNYRKGLPDGSLKSVFVDKSFIEAILSLDETHQLDGVRIYLAKYSEDDEKGRFVVDTETMIIVPTESGIVGAERDIDSAYYDYNHLCPPYCDNDEGWD